jgi:hypothetical protein
VRKEKKEEVKEIFSKNTPNKKDYSLRIVATRRDRVG